MEQLKFSLAVDSLKDTCDALARAEAVVTRERALRDRQVRDARAMGLSYARIARITGLSRDRIYALVNSPPQGV